MAQNESNGMPLEKLLQNYHWGGEIPACAWAPVLSGSSRNFHKLIKALGTPPSKYRGGAKPLQSAAQFP